jgi:hypothetical protein
VLKRHLIECVKVELDSAEVELSSKKLTRCVGETITLADEVCEFASRLSIRQTLSPVREPEVQTETVGLRPSRQPGHLGGEMGHLLPGKPGLTKSGVPENDHVSGSLSYLLPGERAINRFEPVQGALHRAQFIQSRVQHGWSGPYPEALIDIDSLDADREVRGWLR